MARKTATQLQRVENVLRRNKRGVTAARLASLTKIAPSNIYKRVSELSESVAVAKTRKVVDGKRTLVYQLSA
jgi:hypothetical protein